MANNLRGEVFDPGGDVVDDGEAGGEADSEGMEDSGNGGGGGVDFLNGWDVVNEANDDGGEVKMGDEPGEPPPPPLLLLLVLLALLLRGRRWGWYRG